MLFEYLKIKKILGDYDINLPEIEKFTSTDEKHFYEYNLYDNACNKFVNIRIIKKNGKYYISKLILENIINRLSNNLFDIEIVENAYIENNNKKNQKRLDLNH